MITGMHFLSSGTGMHDGLALWIVGVPLFCLLWVIHVFNSSVFSMGMHDGLEMGLMWSWNGKKL